MPSGSSRSTANSLTSSLPTGRIAARWRKSSSTPTRNRRSSSALRGVCLLTLARAGLPVSEYATRLVKKAIVGTGGAEKAQVQAMLKVLLPGVRLAGADAADALAVAIAHAHLVRG